MVGKKKMIMKVGRETTEEEKAEYGRKCVTCVWLSSVRRSHQISVLKGPKLQLKENVFHDS